MGLGDRIRGFFSRQKNPVLRELDQWVSEHDGIEAFIEPRTATQPASVLLVDREGRHIRGPVNDPQDAVLFCERHAIPVYDAQVIGYPKRMRDFDKRRRAQARDSLDAEIAGFEKRLGNDEARGQTDS